jgi:DNA repair protein RadC
MTSTTQLENVHTTLLTPFTEWHEPGYYTLSGPASEDDILKMAKQITRKRFATTGDKLTDGSAAIQFIQSQIGDLSQQHFSVLFLSSQNDVIGFEVLFKGSYSSCAVYRREIFKRAIELNAVSLILGANRPSGHILPSELDISTAKAIKVSAEYFGMSVLDSIIVSPLRTYSLASHGEL